MLKPINKKTFNGTVWCVPSAVSMITGLGLSESHSMASVVQGISVDDVSGMWDDEAILMLHELGYSATPVDLVSRYAEKTPCGPTLKRFLSERTPEEYANVMYVTVHGHALCAHMGYVGDNSTGRAIPMAKFPKLGRLTKSAYIIRELPKYD